MNTLQRLHLEQDQSPWIDFIDRDLVESGRLNALIRDGIRGLTSNPTIFANAIASGQYDALVHRTVDEGRGNEAIYEAIAVGDVGEAADRLRPVYDASEGRDGFASIEVEPALAHDTAASLERARHLWHRLHRPNVFVKIPASEEGIPAIAQAIGEGININVTLMFGVDVYRRVAHAYIEGLERRRTRGGDLTRIASVASFFVSRVDTKLDKRLTAIGSPPALAARGTAAIANARLAYAAYQEIFHGDAFARLRAAGARPQRCLWASMSAKDPNYSDVLYVDALIGPETVNTMPIATIEAFLDHGEVARTLDRDLEAARRTLQSIEDLGIRMRDVTDELLTEGIASFGKSVDELLAAIERKRRALAPSSPSYGEPLSARQ